MIYALLFYLLFLVAYAIFSIIAIYHLRRFGYVGDLTRKAIVLYSIFSIVVIGLSFMFILTSSWPTEFSI